MNTIIPNIYVRHIEAISKRLNVPVEVSEETEDGSYPWYVWSHSQNGFVDVPKFQPGAIPQAFHRLEIEDKPPHLPSDSLRIKVSKVVTPIYPDEPVNYFVVLHEFGHSQNLPKNYKEFRMVALSRDTFTTLGSLMASYRNEVAAWEWALDHTIIFDNNLRLIMVRSLASYAKRIRRFNKGS